MQGSRAVQVVLGEGEPGILRLVLEAEGFHVVGQARGEAELRRVLDATHPSVIVLDAGISATAAIDARTRSLGAQLVLVWPLAVRTGLADERVDPATILRDLGGAVRRAAERATPSADEVVRIPDSRVVVPVEPHLRLVDLPNNPSAPPAGRRRRGRRLLVAAAIWTLSLTASAAIAFSVPQAFDLSERRFTPHAPSGSSVDDDPIDRIVPVPYDGDSERGGPELEQRDDSHHPDGVTSDHPSDGAG